MLALVLAAAGAWLAQASRSLDESLQYAYTPGELVEEAPKGDVRVGGQVVPGSVRWSAEAGVVRFLLRDERGTVPVLQCGAPPALFRAGEGAVVEGRLVDGVLVSSTVIVRHDNEYRPPGSGES